MQPQVAIKKTKLDFFFFYKCVVNKCFSSSITTMSVTTKLGLFLLLLVQYSSTTVSARYFEKHVLICKRKCRAQHQKDLAQCDKDCLQPYIDWQETENAREVENVFVFHNGGFNASVDDEDGYVLVYPRFDRRSDVFQGIRNYRVVASRANPSTFLSPSHRNIDSVAVVINGRASITLIHQGNKETHNVQFGDVFRIQAGTIVHYVNPDDDLQLFHMLELTANTPDYFESFFAAGSNNHQSNFNFTSNYQESFYSAFSDEILQAAFNTDKDEARKLFQGRNDWVFVKVSQEQIKALLSDQNSLESGNQRFSTPYNNIFNQDPSYSNIYGKLYEIKPQDYQQIQDLDIQLTYVNITKGAMFGPYHNSRSTTIAMVMHGRGYFQVACPHLSQQLGASYNASAELLSGDIFVVPAGHPVVIVNSGDINFEVLYFEVNARDNKRIPLAGMNNELKQLSKEAKQLSFNMSSEQVNDILDKQKKSWFFPGPGQPSDRAST